MAKKKVDAVVPVGKKIKKERLKKKMSLDRIANETGFSIEFRVFSQRTGIGHKESYQGLYKAYRKLCLYHPYAGSRE
jgi:transcriptional regulator with XRE-family HTH domain